MSNEISFIEENKERIEHLKSEIIKAFGEVAQPTKDNIAPHECNECRWVREDFTNVKWQEASDALLEENHGKLQKLSEICGAKTTKLQSFFFTPNRRRF